MSKLRAPRDIHFAEKRPFRRFARFLSESSATLPELTIQCFGSTPMRSLTADQSRWVQSRQAIEDRGFRGFEVGQSQDRFGAPALFFPIRFLLHGLWPATPQANDRPKLHTVQPGSRVIRSPVATRRGREKMVTLANASIDFDG